jgi:rhamnulokinase
MESLWNSLMSRKETFERTGINFYIFNTLLQLLSYKESGLPEKTAHLLFIPGYIQYLLCGRIKNELTISSTSQMLNVGSGSWDEKILSRLNIPANIMGDPVPPGSILGKINHEGIASRTIDAVAVCAHDTASAVAAIPAEDASFAFISTGTWCIVGMENDRPILSESALGEGFTNERGYDNTFRFLKNIIGLWLVQGLMNEMAEPTTYDKLESLATDSPGGCLVVPDDAAFYNPSSMKGAFDDFFRKTGQQIPGDMGSYFRCAYDSLIFSFRYHIRKMEQMTGRSIESIHLIGGGSQSEYLSSETARVCRRAVLSGPVEAATIGNILVQAIALERISGLPEARELVRKSFNVKTYRPGPDVDSSDREYSRFLRLREEVLENS